jgi:hypothetical protein
MRKRNFQKHEYESQTIPEERNCLATNIMEMLVNCDNCWRKLTFGETYTSKQWHIGYPVCSECYEKECEMEKKYAND